MSCFLDISASCIDQACDNTAERRSIFPVGAQVIFDELAARCKNDFTGSICVKLWESHKAWACYEGDVGGHEDLECLGDAESHNDT